MEPQGPLCGASAYRGSTPSRLWRASAAVVQALGYASVDSATKAILRLDSRLSAHAKVVRRIERRLSEVR